MWSASSPSSGLRRCRWCTEDSGWALLFEQQPAWRAHGIVLTGLAEAGVQVAFLALGGELLGGEGGDERGGDEPGDACEQACAEQQEGVAEVNGVPRFRERAIGDEGGGAPVRQNGGAMAAECE